MPPGAAADKAASTMLLAMPWDAAELSACISAAQPDVEQVLKIGSREAKTVHQVGPDFGGTECGYCQPLANALIEASQLRILAEGRQALIAHENDGSPTGIAGIRCRQCLEFGERFCASAHRIFDDHDDTTVLRFQLRELRSAMRRTGGSGHCGGS